MALVFAQPAWAAPQRIVSLDYCADQFVLALADREQIAGVSRGALREDSYYRERASGLRQTRGTLEEVLALRPDLVVRNWGGPWDAGSAFARFGVPVLQVSDAPDFSAAREELLAASRVMGHPERGEVLARDLDLRLARLRTNGPRPAPPVMYLSAGGAVAGRGVMMDAVIRAAGGRNVRTDAGWVILPLERMVETPPALIALAFFGHQRMRMNAWQPGRHAVVERALNSARTVSLPVSSIACESWLAIDAAETIAGALSQP
jgi:iron complex transport system substrate-binding protein